MVTGSLEKVDGIAGLDLVTVNYFDNRLRVICTVKDNHLGVRNNNFFAYNFSDQVVTEAVVHNASSSPDEIMLITNYTYDHQGRLLEEKLKMNDQPQVTTKAYEYNELGDLVNTYMHGSATGQNFNQNVKNKYNIRGWLRMINNPENLDHDLFGMDLRYESQTNTGTIGVTPKYNGNIAQMRWNSKSDTQRGYGFEYDKLNRLTTAIYGQGANLNSNQDWYKTTYDYDPNGNFTNLTRKKDNVLIDNLTYNYYGNDKSNRLFSVNDQGTIEGYVPATGNYTYDANANMTHDPSKLINVVYNHLNLPRQINFGPEDNIQYAYTATGTKLRKTVTTMKTTTGSVMDYCGNFIYSDNQIITIFAGDVRIVPVNVGNSTFWKYEYSMKDHLGNVRVVFAAHSHGQPELLQQTSYYPFGMTLQQQNFSSQNTTENKYLYNSKELQDDQLAGNTLDWYDYGWRFYDPLTVRFTIVDPLAENFPWATSYSYCFNNPINSIDPDGREPITLSVLAVKGLIGAGIDISIQMTANMTLKNQSFGQAFRNIDWTSAGGSFVAGAVGIPGVTAISKTAKVATIATAVAVDAAVDVSIAEGNQNIFNGEKSLTTASIDAVGSLIGGKASDDIVKGTKNSISNDISSGTFSTLNKAEKNTLRQTQTVVNSQGFEAGTKTAVGLGTEIGKQGAKSIVGSGNPSGNTAPLMQNYTQPSDNTRVVRPIYPLPEFK